METKSNPLEIFVLQFCFLIFGRFRFIITNNQGPNSELARFRGARDGPREDFEMKLNRRAERDPNSDPKSEARGESNPKRPEIVPGGVNFSGFQVRAREELDEQEPREEVEKQEARDELE